MRTGTIEANLPRLNAAARLSYLDELIERKRSGCEKEPLSQADLRFHQSEYERLVAELEAAQEASFLPERPRAGAALNDLLIRLRLPAAP